MCSAYGAKVASLVPATTPSPKHCKDLNCQLRPKCYTNYLPRYSNMSLTSLVVGHSQWMPDDESYNDWSLHYGYLDAKPMYVASDEAAEQAIHVRVNVNASDAVWFFHDAGKSLHDCQAIVELDVASARMDTYEHKKDAVAWPHKMVHGTGALVVHNLPAGQHVVTLMTSKEAVARLSHVVMW
jgi:hypothetical protein